MPLEQGPDRKPARRICGRIPDNLEATVHQECEAVARLTRGQLAVAAVARGCWHYAPIWPDVTSGDRPDIPHEVLGCALMRGPQDAETFQAIRCGAMVLSDAGNSPSVIAIAATQLGVVGRVAHVACLGTRVDDRVEFWRSVLSRLPEVGDTEQDVREFQGWSPKPE